MFKTLKKWTAHRAGTRRPTQVRPSFETLESRDLMTLGFGTPPLNLFSIANPTPLAGTLTPDQVRHAYGFDQIPMLAGNYNGLAGQGETIAIVMGNDNPNILPDLQEFDRQFGLPDPPSLTVTNQAGGSSLPGIGNIKELEEIAIDVEWSHAIAPAARILLVEANSMNTRDLFAGVDYARRQPGVVVVSMSFAVYSGLSGEAVNNSIFTTPAGHAGVSFVAASGDTGVIAYPASSPNVLAIGGTVLSLTADNSIKSETAWSGSGGGQDPYEATPSYQQGLGLANRGTPDVAYAAQNFAVYEETNGTGWMSRGGTSCGAPQWSALTAIIDQGRALAGQAPLDGASQLLPALYQLPSNDFNDVTSGSNKVATAGPGYDLVTGLGSPHADRIVNDMVYGFQVTLQNGALSVSGAQNGVVNDVISVDTNSSGGVSVTENGHTASFTAGQVTSLTLTPGSGSNQVNINGVPSGVSVNVSSGLGTDSVTVGNGSLSSVAGPVSVSNTSGKTALTIDDSSDVANRIATITNNSVQFTGLNKISYSGNINSLQVNGGSGNDGYYVKSTGSGTPLSLVTGIGQNSVNVGNGSLANIAGAVNVQANASGKTGLIVDDFQETGRNATVAGNSVWFTGVPTITFSGITALTVVGSGGNNTIAVDSVPTGVAVTVYNTQHNAVIGSAASQSTRFFMIPGWDFVAITTRYAPAIAGLLN